MSGKRIVNAYKTVNKDQAYALKEAVKIVKENATAKFDETIDVAINLGVDPKYADQMVRGVCALPNGSGKKYALPFLLKVKKPMKQKLPVPILSEQKIWLIPLWQAKSISTAVSLPRI